MDAVRAAWVQHLERWKASGLSAKQFAAESGINWRSLSWWKWRIGGGEPTRKKRSRAPAASSVEVAKALSPLSFVEVTASVTREPIEVVLPSALRVRVPVGFDDATLVRLLDVLERRG